MRSYLIATGVLSLLVLLMCVPSLLLTLTFLTLGLAFLASQVVINLFVLAILILPAVLISQRSLRAGVILSGSTVLAASLGPGILGYLTQKYHPMLQPQISAEAHSGIVSIEFILDDRFSENDFRPCEGDCLRILQDTNLDWVRLQDITGRDLVFKREDGFMRLTGAFSGSADITVQEYNGRRGRPPKSTFALWEMNTGPEGFTVRDNRQGEILSRNIAAVVLGPELISWVFVGMEIDGPANFSLVKKRRIVNLADPERTLESELTVLGLLTAETGEGITINFPDVIDTKLSSLISNTPQDSQKRSSFSPTEAFVVNEFLFQVQQGVEVDRRLELIVQTAFDPRFKNYGRFAEILDQHETVREFTVQHLAQYRHNEAELNRLVSRLQQRHQQMVNEALFPTE